MSPMATDGDGVKDDNVDKRANIDKVEEVKHSELLVKTWNRFLAFINSGNSETGEGSQDSLEQEPSEEDYLRYFAYLRKVKKQKIFNLRSLFQWLSDRHKQKHGKDVQCTWKKISQMLGEKNATEVMAEKVAKVKTWKDFLAFIDTSEEPKQDDYLRYFDYLWEVKNQKSSNLWSTFQQLSDHHKQEYGGDVQGTWDKISEMFEKKNGVEVVEEKVAKSLPEKSKRLYEKSWKDFLAFADIEGEPTEDDYIREAIQ